jgi:hypothetical protein
MYAHDKEKFMSPNLTTDYIFATWNWEVTDAIPLEIDDFALIDCDCADDSDAIFGIAWGADPGRRTG